MDIKLFDYKLPEELIAQFPSRRRDRSRLMVLNRTTGEREIMPFGRIVDYLGPDDALVVNNTRVFKARLYGNRTTGARVEVFLVRPVEDVEGETWLALVKPSRRVREGEDILFGEDAVTLCEYRGEGQWLVQFRSRTARDRVVSRHGHIPLPHYIQREDAASDIRRYQTVYADKDRIGAVAAPTAGFHFTKSLLGDIRQMGVRVVELTLHVGPGTFKPVGVERIEEHVVDPEFAELSIQAARELNGVRARGGKIFAVGTTSVRTLESATLKAGKIQPLSGMVDLYIKPGHEFRVVDSMVTNFHLPKSSLLILVSAFAGRERMLAAYDEAIRRKMRFYSYGDAMLIL